MYWLLCCLLCVVTRVAIATTRVVIATAGVAMVTGTIHRNFFTTLPYTTGVYTTDNAVDELHDCVLATCPAVPVCGTDCQMYPSSCYLQYIACSRNTSIQEMSLSRCVENAPLELQALPTTISVLYGGSLQLTCAVEEGGVATRVAWFEVTSDTIQEIISSTSEAAGEATSEILNITNIQKDRYFFCQVSNCNQQILQSSTVHVTIPENICIIYGTGHFYTFTQQAYSYQSECTYVAAMDALRGLWFVYVRFERTWQIASASLSTVTFYYNHVPVELQRGWIVNYFGRKIVVREGESKDMFGMHLTFDGLYMTISTPEVTLSWDGLGSLIVGVPPGSPTCGLCGSNNREEVQLQHRYQSGAMSTTHTVVQSWALDKRHRCVYQEDNTSVTMTTTRAATMATTRVIEDSVACDRLGIDNISRQTNSFYTDNCVKDMALTDLMVGSTPTYCWSHLALSHLRDKLANNITTTLDSTCSCHGDTCSCHDNTCSCHGNSTAVCALSVLRRQYLAYYAGCPNSTPPFDVT